MSGDKKQKMMLGVLGVLVAAAAGAWYVGRDSDASANRRANSGPSQRRQKDVSSKTRAKPKRREKKKAKPKAQKAERRQREASEKIKSKRRGKKRGSKKTKKKKVSPAA